MDELIIAGKLYISSKRAADLTGYAKDYVGQLIREGKIDGTRVGRAWYVDQASVLQHSGSESVAISPIGPSGIQNSSMRASLSSRKLTPAIIQSERAIPKTWSEVVYSNDSVDLFPHIIKTSEQTDAVAVRANDRKAISDSPDITNDSLVLSEEKIHPIRLSIINAKVTPSHIVRTTEKILSTSSVENRTTRRTSGGSRRLVVSFALLAIGILSIGSMSTGLFITNEIRVHEGDSDYVASIFLSSEYLIDLLDSF